MMFIKQRFSIVAVVIVTVVMSFQSCADHSRPQTDATNALFTSSTLEIIDTESAIKREFKPLHPESPNGPRYSAVEGNPKNEPSFTIFRYSKNYTNSGKLHNHTYGYKLFLIEGQMKHWKEDGSQETATLLTPGSYLYQPKDEFHAANCLTEQCTAYVIFDGPIKTGFPEK